MAALNLSDMKAEGASKKKNDARKSAKTKESIAELKAKTATKAAEEAAPESSADDDDEDLSAVFNATKKNPKMTYIVAGVLVVVAVVFVFLMFMGRGKQNTPTTPTPEQPSTPAQTITTPTPTQPTPEQPSAPTPSNNIGTVGTQDFSTNTNMSNSDIMTNPDQYVSDIYGLTTRVDYTVESIATVADFVSYEKHRGTWGGGLELYWLDATYKNNHYVVQVPFKYYKELDEVGIVPVSMEVLTIKGASEGQTLSVISFMELDEATLKSILKTQSK